MIEYSVADRNLTETRKISASCPEEASTTGPTEDRIIGPTEDPMGSLTGGPTTTLPAKMTSLEDSWEVPLSVALNILYTNGYSKVY